MNKFCKCSGRAFPFFFLRRKNYLFKKLIYCRGAFPKNANRSHQPNPNGVEFASEKSVTSKVLLEKNYFMNKLSGLSRRRRRLAGHLFQDRWKDQGRGFILLPPWPPNFLGQILTVRDFSQHLVSSSKTIRPNIPRGARCMGHCEMM